MTIAVILEQVPDVVEELAIAPSGNELDRDTVTYVLNEYDDHALEEALLLAEASGDEVIAVGIDTTGELDQALYTALAKGAKRAIKLVGDFRDLAEYPCDSRDPGTDPTQSGAAPRADRCAGTGRSGWATRTDTRRTARLATRQRGDRH
jgi:hypothetical protein